MNYESIELARYIIRYCDNLSIPVKNIELQTLLYIVQAKLGIIKDICIADSDGPVFPYCYGYFEHIAPHYEDLTWEMIGYQDVYVSPEDMKAIRSIINKYLLTVTSSDRRALVCHGGGAWIKRMESGQREIPVMAISSNGINEGLTLAKEIHVPSINLDMLEDRLKPVAKKMSQNEVRVVLPFLDINGERIAVCIKRDGESIELK